MHRISLFYKLRNELLILFFVLSSLLLSYFYFSASFIFTLPVSLVEIRKFDWMTENRLTLLKSMKKRVHICLVWSRLGSARLHVTVQSRVDNPDWYFYRIVTGHNISHFSYWIETELLMISNLWLLSEL